MEKITEENCREKLSEYAQSKYSEEEFEAAIEKYPHDLTWLDNHDECRFREREDWFNLVWKDPKTGKTVVRQFTEDVEMEPWLKIEMLKMEQVRHSAFEILERHGKLMRVRDMHNGEKLEIILKGDENHNQHYKKGRIFEGSIHPWKGAYLLAGILKLRIT